MSQRIGDDEKRNASNNDAPALFGLDLVSRDRLKIRVIQGRAKLKEVMEFFKVKKKDAEQIMKEWKELGTV